MGKSKAMKYTAELHVCIECPSCHTMVMEEKYEENTIGGSASLTFTCYKCKKGFDINTDGYYGAWMGLKGKEVNNE